MTREGERHESERRRAEKRKRMMRQREREEGGARLKNRERISTRSLAGIVFLLLYMCASLCVLNMCL